MSNENKISFVDNLRLLHEINTRIVDYEGDHKPVQEFARLAGISNWKKPTSIYDILNKRRPASVEWTKNTAELLGIHPYYIYARWIVEEIVSGFIEELQSENTSDELKSVFGESNLSEGLKILKTRLSNDIFYIKDKSMEPVFNKDSTMKVSIENELNSPDFLSGQIYFVENAYNDQKVRVLYLEPDGEKYLVQPLNKSFQTFVINTKDIKRISKVLI